MARKSTSAATAAAAAGTSTSTTPSSAGPAALAQDPLPTTKVNPANLSEIKQALDDVIRQHLSPPAYAPSHLHANVHLALGYLSVGLAAFAVFYSWKREWEESKAVLWACTAGYFGLQSGIWGWKRWAEAGEVWSGRTSQGGNKVKLSITSATTLDPPPNPAPMVRITKDTCPGYVLTVSVTGLGPRELIVVAGRGVGELIDSAGGVEAGEITRWLDKLLVSAGLDKKMQ